MHLHLNQLPGWLAKKDSDTSKCQLEVLAAISSLDFTHHKVQVSANHARFLIQELTSASGMMPNPQDVYDSVQDFIYHYENYCLRAYILREKIILYLNSGLQIGFSTKEVNIRMIKMNPTVKKAGLMGVIDKFDSSKKSPFGKLIKHRKSLTHNLSYGLADPYLRPTTTPDDEVDFSEWSKKWSRNILAKAKEIDAAHLQLSSINHALAEKVVAYREPLRPSKKSNKLS